VVKVGTIDDPVWTEVLPPLPSSGISLTLPKSFRWLMAAVAVVLLIFGGWWLFSGGQGSGDPGAKIMNQLTPATSSLPGYGSDALPWVRAIPQSLDASYMIRIEPQQDSCDGRSGTQGWSQVVVQSRFQWNRGLPALITFMQSRLSKLGWSAMPQPLVSYPPSQNWTKTLNNGTRAVLNVTQEGGTNSSVWQLNAIGAPLGKAASC
jgi:hypothetical protein